MKIIQKNKKYSPPEVFCKICVLTNTAKFRGKHDCFYLNGLGNLKNKTPQNNPFVFIVFASS